MSDPIIPNIVVSVSGIPKTGKTHFACTFPEPIKLFSFDRGAARVLRNLPDRKVDVESITLPIIEDTTDTWALPIWESFYAKYKETVAEGKYQTIILDTATAVEEVLRQAVLEYAQELAAEKNRNKQRLATTEYLSRNLKMSAIFDQAKDAGINLVVIQYLRERWVKKPGTDQFEPTGEMIIDGWARTEGQADINIEMTTKDKAGKTVMIATIKSNGFNRDANRKAYEDMTYDDLTAVMF